MSAAVWSRRWFVLLPVIAAGCAKKSREPGFDFGEPKKQYAMRGEVLRLRAGNRIAVVKHEKIEGWMEAMTMDFPVPDAAEYDKLREGQRIRATVQVNDLHYWMTNIQVEP